MFPRVNKRFIKVIKVIKLQEVYNSNHNMILLKIRQDRKVALARERSQL
jgi:hypothetical protein